MTDKVMPTSDLGFKKILASNEHKTITQGFIADFFDVHVELNDIHIVNPYSIHAYQEAAQESMRQVLRETSRDITVKVDLADVTVELQLRRQPTYIQRAYYYLADLYTAGYDRKLREDHENARTDADHYAGLRPAWSISILGETLFASPNAFHMFKLHDPNTGEGLVPELVRLGFYELTKPDTCQARAKWRNFLLSGQVGTTDPEYLHEAASIIEYVNLSSEERQMIDQSEKYLADMEAERYYARKEAREEGLAEGRVEGLAEGRVEGARDTQLATARAALRLRLPHDQVMAITGLDAATIDRLANGLVAA